MQANRFAAVVLTGFAFMSLLSAVASSYKILHIFDGSKNHSGVNPQGTMAVEMLCRDRACWRFGAMKRH